MPATMPGRNTDGSYWVAFLVILCSLHAQAQVQHGHNGVLQPYNGVPPEVGLTPAEMSAVEQGRAIYKNLSSSDGNRAVTVFRVNAPARNIWSVISDFESYPEWIDDVVDIEIYGRVGGDIFVRFTAKKLFGGKIVWYARHDFPQKERDWGTWTLDYDRRSDIDDSVGFWRVSPVPNMPDKSDVTYSADIRFKAWIPRFVEKSIIDKGLQEVPNWVKIQSENRSNTAEVKQVAGDK